MADVSEVVEFSTMRAPKDVIRMINSMASLDGRSIQDWNNTDLREFVTAKFKARMAKEGSADPDDPIPTHDIGGEAGGA